VGEVGAAFGAANNTAPNVYELIKDDWPGKPTLTASVPGPDGNGGHTARVAAER
jgi:hypothetical protein